MKTSEFFKQKTVLSLEVFPPKRTAPVDTVYKTLDGLKGITPDFISVTYGAGGIGNSRATLEIASSIKHRYGIESVAHMPCLHLTKEEAARILEQLKEHQIENILALRGDRIPDMEPAGGFKYAADLVGFIRDHGDFNIIGACYPEGHQESGDLVQDIRNLKQKVDAGVSQLITQLFFDNRLFYDFASDCKNNGITVPVTPGIMPVTSAAQIQRMVKMCGATLPDSLQKIVERYADNKPAMMEAGIYYAVNQILDLLANDMHGIHLYTMNNPEVAKKICAGIQHLI